MNKKLLRYFVSNAVTQSNYNKKHTWEKLPDDQQAALNELLNGVHDCAKIYKKNIAKIDPKYKSQVIDALILKAAVEFGWNNKNKRS